MTVPPDAVEHKAHYVVHPQSLDRYPELNNFLRTSLADICKPVWVQQAKYDDLSPHTFIKGAESGAPVALIPGFISGQHAEEQLVHLSQIGHTLRFAHPLDPRTPWVQKVHYLFSDLEGRGNKPTVGPDGQLLPNAELHYMYYLADTLKGPGKMDEATILDPHDWETINALGVPVTCITGMGECIEYMKKNDLLSDIDGVVVADDGAMGRALWFSNRAGIPILARIVKERVNGKPKIKEIYGAQNVAGKKVLLVDDMIATGGTQFTDSSELIQQGATDVIGVVTHVKGAEGARDRIAEYFQKPDRPLSRLIITNSTPYARQLAYIPGVLRVDVFPLLGRAAKAALAPTDENVAALAPNIFPLGSIDEYKAALFTVYPELAPDYKPTVSREAPFSLATPS